jgi:hypothetical protein
MPELGLSLGLWQGTFRDIPKLWLRWFTLTGELIPEPTEEAAAANERVILAEQETIEAKRKVEQLGQLLRDLGVNPDTLDNA